MRPKAPLPVGNATAEENNVFFPQQTILCTEQLFLFLRDFQRLVDFFFFGIELATKADKMVEIASTALKKENTSDYGQRLSSFSFTNSRNLVTTTVDSFLWYLSAIIQEAIKRRPEILKSNETISVDEIVDFRSRSELMNYIIDRKINSLSYGGMRQMEKYLRERLGVDTFEGENARRTMNIFVELRNIYVHNRGYVNRIFISRAPSHDRFTFELGKRYQVGFDDFVLLSRTCVNTAIRLDGLISVKFGIKRVRFATWLKKGKIAAERSWWRRPTA